MRIGDAVKLWDGAVCERRRELAGEAGRIGDVWRDGDVVRCTMVFEALRCLLCDAPAADFVPAADRAETMH